MMALLSVEKVGGLAGFNVAGAHLRSHGQIDTSTIPIEDQRAVEALFKSQSKPNRSPVCDGFRYRITRSTSAGTQTIEVPEALAPSVLVQCVKDELI